MPPRGSRGGRHQLSRGPLELEHGATSQIPPDKLPVDYSRTAWAQEKLHFRDPLLPGGGGGRHFSLGSGGRGPRSKEEADTDRSRPGRYGGPLHRQHPASSRFRLPEVSQSRGPDDERVPLEGSSLLVSYFLAVIGWDSSSVHGFRNRQESKGLDGPHADTPRNAA